MEEIGINMEVNFYAQTDVGQVRQRNEDCLFTDPENGIYIVCDGMGGHDDGHIASKYTTEIVSEYIKNNTELYQVNKLTINHKQKIKRMVSAAINEAAKKVYQLSLKQELESGMGTTVVMALKVGNEILVSHVGDSRCYLRRGQKLHQLTEDHTLGNELLKSGEMTPEAVENFAQAEALSQAVGIGDHVQVSHVYVQTRTGDKLILCSDGLTKYAGKKEIFQLFANSLEPAVASSIEYANKLGGKDNITIIGLEIEKEQDSQEVDADEKLESLKKLPIFRDLNYRELNIVLENMSEQHFKAGDNIITQGLMGEDLFILLDGMVDILINDTKVNEVSKGNAFGEISLIDKQPRSATVQAQTDLITINISRKDFLSLIKKENYLGVKLLWNMSRHLGKLLRNRNEE
jgi:serine/threonine protein phosphatase PrpC